MSAHTPTTTARPATGRSLLATLSWLLPLLVALASAFWIDSLQPSADMQQQVRARDDIRVLTAALLAPRAPTEPQGLPTTAQGLQSLVSDGLLTHLPVDPWGRPYQYRQPGQQRNWELYSLGADGVVSQDDIVSWNLYGGR